jgi:hypothetical protein
MYNNTIDQLIPLPVGYCSCRINCYRLLQANLVGYRQLVYRSWMRLPSWVYWVEELKAASRPHSWIAQPHPMIQGMRSSLSRRGIAQVLWYC